MGAVWLGVQFEGNWGSQWFKIERLSKGSQEGEGWLMTIDIGWPLANDQPTLTEFYLDLFIMHFHLFLKLKNLVFSFDQPGSQCFFLFPSTLMNVKKSSAMH